MLGMGKNIQTYMTIRFDLWMPNYIISSSQVDPEIFELYFGIQKSESRVKNV